ncbi:hypothetical protein T484DRAFT_1914643, partial [Baffinella frigidus]
RRGSEGSEASLQAHWEASSTAGSEASTASANRRLLEGSITVTCEVDAASVSDALSLSQRLTPSRLVENLENQGLPGATVLTPPEVATRVKVSQ